MKEKASVLYLGEETKDDNEDSTYFMIKSIYEGNATITPSFATQLAQNPCREKEFEKHVQWVYKRLVELSSSLKYKVDIDEVRKIENGIHTNSFSLDFQEGFAVFMACSLVNHSCKENLGWHTVGDYMYYTALRDIAFGEELTVSYSFPNLNEKRIDYYKSYYGFSCDCPYCTKGIDNWRVFTCSVCGGMIYPDEGGWKCHSCDRKIGKDEIAYFEAEEVAIKNFKKESRYRWYYKPMRKMSPGHLYLFKALRNYFMTKSCPNPIQLAEEVLIPVAEFHKEQTHGRLYASLMEQYAIALLKYSQVMKCIEEQCREKALDCLHKAYDYRCSIGMGVTRFAAAIYLENLELFDPVKLKENKVIYKEF